MNKRIPGKSPNPDGRPKGAKNYVSSYKVRSQFIEETYQEYLKALLAGVKSGQPVCLQIYERMSNLYDHKTLVVNRKVSKQTQSEEIINSLPDEITYEQALTELTIFNKIRDDVQQVVAEDKDDLIKQLKIAKDIYDKL